MTITEFLEARIAEDEALATNALGLLGMENAWWEWRTLKKWFDAISRADAMHMEHASPHRTLLECAAKRAIAGLHKEGADQCDEHNAMFESIPCPTIRALAAVYAGHPDYDQEWS